MFRSAVDHGFDGDGPGLEQWRCAKFQESYISSLRVQKGLTVQTYLLYAQGISSMLTELQVAML